jgi:iron complex outermembrane recepter protein
MMPFLLIRGAGRLCREKRVLNAGRGVSVLALAIHLICCAASAGNSQQQGSLKDLSLEQLGNVEITSVNKEPEQVWKTAAAVFIITHDDIIRSGATSIPEALRLAPGVEVARIESNKWAIGIRGFGSRLARSVLVLIDGRTVYTPLFAGTYWEVQNVVMEDIDRIEIIRGPGATIWGPNAINGVINIITKGAASTQGWYIDGGGGNVERGFGDARYGGTVGKASYRAYVMGFNRGPEFHPDGEDFDTWTAGQTGFRLDWAKNERDQITFQGDLYDQAAGERVTATTYNPPASNIVDGLARLSGGNIMARWTRSMGQDRDFQLQAYYDRTNRHEPNFGDLRNTFDVDTLFRMPLGGGNRISFGGGIRIDGANELEVVSGLTFDPAKHTDNLITGFVQDELNITPNLELTTGTKILHTNYIGVDVQPTVRLLWTPSQHQSYWAAFTRAVRTPADVERNFFLSGFIATAPGPPPIPFFARFNANRNFRSESLQGYEAGVRHLFGKNVYVDLAAFFNQYGNLFSEEITGAPFIETSPAPTHILLPARFGNGLKATTSGGEIAPEWRPTNFWRLRGSYSFLAMHIQKPPGSLDLGSGPATQGSSPQHQVELQTSFDIRKFLSLDVLYRYVSALPGQSVSAYHTADARFAWHIQSVTLSVVGQNLLQPHHFAFGADPGFVGIKRGVYGKIEWRR